MLIRQFEPLTVEIVKTVATALLDFDRWLRWVVQLGNLNIFVTTLIRATKRHFIYTSFSHSSCNRSLVH